MLFADNIIEKNSLFLRNLNTNSQNTAADVWSTASSAYGFYSIPYEYRLSANHVYYARYTYKFTTTNQSPTWVAYYVQGGSASFGTNISNPVAGTEYTVSALGRPNITYPAITFTSGTIYNGNSNAIAGVSAQVKNVLVYDITDLYNTLVSIGAATTDVAVKTWCDSNLLFVPRYTNYNISSLVSEILTKINIKKGNIFAKQFVETDGLDCYATTADIRKYKYFDTGNGLSVYNNSGGGTVTHTRVDAKTQNSPFWAEHPYVLKITTNGTASPGAGGFICSHTAAENRIVIERFVAKIPAGYTVYSAYNNQGSGASVSFLTSQAGTGDWAEYAILYKCGATSGSSSFSSGGHVYISGSNNTSVTWYLAYCMGAIITENENLKNYTVLGNVERIKDSYYFSRNINNQNLFPNGNCAKQESSMLPSGWNYDTTDVAGAAKASIVQPVNAGAGIYGKLFHIKPNQRYKVSYWVKCKQDMSSFLTAIIPYLSDKTTSKSHSDIVYQSGTKTQLTTALASGATTVKVKSSANWVARSYSRLGFRNGAYTGYNNVGISNGYNGSTGIVKGVIDSTTIELNTAYTGNTIPVNTYIVESYDGSTYPYPIQKGQLPTDNTWKYVEGYFGSDAIWDGASNNGWAGMTVACPYVSLQLNLYSNNGTVPIKFADIKIEPVYTGSTDRYEEKLQIIGGN